MIVPYEPAHIFQIELQEDQSHLVLTPAHAEVYGKGHCAWTCVDASGKPVGCAGILPVWNDRGICWALLSRNVGRHMAEITRRTIEALDACPYKRLELYARPGFHQSFRWAKVLGFEFEALLEAADPTGGPMALFKRIKRRPGYELLRG